VINVTYPGAGYPAGEPGTDLGAGTTNGVAAAAGASTVDAVGSDNSGVATSVGVATSYFEIGIVTEGVAAAAGEATVTIVGGRGVDAVASASATSIGLFAGAFALAMKGSATGVTTVLGLSIVKRVAIAVAAFTYLPPDPSVWTGRIRR
jgi:hypothetical protein